MKWLTVVAVIILLASCDPLSSVEFKVYNKTTDTVTIAMHKEIMSSSYQGYTIEENDSVSKYYDADSLNVAVLAPDQVLWVQYEWSGLYREELIIPLWKYISTIKIGDKELSPELWNNETAWRMKKSGGERFQGESRFYDLILRDK